MHVYAGDKMSSEAIPIKRCVQFIAALALFCTSNASAAIVLDSGNIAGSSSSVGSQVVAVSMFNLTGAEIPRTQLAADFLLIDDGVEIIVNGTSLFAATELSQFGPQDFVVTPNQPNDINNPWLVNTNGLPRLSVFSDSSGTTMSGAVNTNSASTVPYLPLFAVSDFTSLLMVGANTIEFVNHNGFQTASIQGRYAVSVTPVAVPEPSSMGLGLVMLLSVFRRRRVA